jgi:hypothetical protein
MRRLHRVVNPHFDPSPLPSNGRTMVMLTGSCLCGGVAYEVDAAVGPIAHCHCATCRKAHGSAFSSVSSVPRDKFRWTRRREQTCLPAMNRRPVKSGVFAQSAGSQIVAERAGQSTVILRLGCVDTPITDRPKAHHGSIPRIRFLSCRRASPDLSRRDDSVHPTLKPIREVSSASVSKDVKQQRQSQRSKMRQCK